MNTKVVKSSDKLLHISWKLREALHEANKRIEELETTAKQSYTVVSYYRNENGNLVIVNSNTYDNMRDAKLIFNHLTAYVGMSFLAYRVYILDNYQNRIQKNYDYESELWKAQDEQSERSAVKQ